MAALLVEFIENILKGKSLYALERFRHRRKYIINFHLKTAKK